MNNFESKLNELEAQITRRAYGKSLAFMTMKHNGCLIRCNARNNMNNTGCGNSGKLFKLTFMLDGKRISRANLIKTFQD